MNWNAYFTMMADWKCLPAYKAEPRVDSLIGFYLKEILTEYFGTTIVGIIPELPIKLGLIYPNAESPHRSFKVDFYALGTNGLNYLVEFKTDTDSRRPGQDSYLEKAKGIGMRGLVQGIVSINDVSIYEDKYSHLLNKMSSMELLGADRAFIGKTDTIEIIYIQPSKKVGTEKVIDFLWVAEWLVKTYPNQEFELAFAAALKKWARD